MADRTRRMKVVGLGEVGKAIFALCDELGYFVVGQDTDGAIIGGYDGELSIGRLLEIEGELGVEYDVVHICIPFGEDFEEECLKFADTEGAELIVIHSTVPVGTTKRLNDKLGWKLFVHSPVRGVHPNLLGGLKTFQKFVGVDGGAVMGRAVRYLAPMFDNILVVRGSSTSELAKIMSTTYYGWCIIFQKEMKRLCDEYGVDFNFAYTKWNEGYNEGYRKLGMDNVVRPVLKDMPGPIGGHCVVQNAGMIDSYLTNELSRMGLLYEAREVWNRQE